MSTHEIKHAIGTFPNRQSAEMALNRLREANFDLDKISIVAKHDDKHIENIKDNRENHQVQKGAKVGATAGGVTGGIIGLVSGLGVLAIPGVGPVAELGVVLANTLLGGGIGAAGGGLVGALIGWGIPEEKAKFYDDRLSQGDYVVMMEGTGEEVHSAEVILNRHGIRNWSIYNAPEAAIGSRQTMPYSSH